MQESPKPKQASTPEGDGQPPLYPLKFAPVYKEKVWGGYSLEKLGRCLPGGRAIGESWELVDLAKTSASGGGGNAERSTVANGPLAGQTFAKVIKDYGRTALGDVPLTADGGFPLLVKFLDAHENLSVQVHPSPAYAAAHADSFLKSEAWYIVDCAPGSVIYKGMRPGVTPQQLREALAQNNDDAVLPLLESITVKPGDCHYLPSGTCHALGAGILAAEVQTPSDTTYRVYDWGRTGRELHVEQALQCIHFGPAQSGAFEFNQTVETAVARVTKLVACEHFAIDRIEAVRDFDEEMSTTQPEVWITLEGSGRLSTHRGAFGSEVHITAGDTVYLPPNLPNAKARINAGATALRVTFPQAGGNRLA